MADVGCTGILVADTFCGPMPELPRAGELLAVGPMLSQVGGCAANVAAALAKQGFSVEVAGCVGDDADAEIVRGGLEENGIDCKYLTTDETEPTSKTIIVLVEGQDRRYLHNFGANAAFSARHIHREWLKGLEVFYLGGLFALPGINLQELRETLRFCRENGVVTVLDVVVPQGFSAGDDWKTLLPLTDYFLPNDDEAETLTGESTPENQLRALREMGATTVVVTQGEGGAVAARGEKTWRCDVASIKVVDPSGAGDAFAAGVICGALRGFDVPQTLQLASVLGASATREIGTTRGVFTTREADEFLQNNAPHVREGTQ